VKSIPRQGRLLIWLSLILIVGFVTVSVLNFLVSSASIRERISLQTLPLTADNVYSEIQKDLLRPVFISSLMANDTFVRDWILGGEKDVSQIARYLNEVKTKYDVVIASLTIDKTRRYYYHGGLLRVLDDPDAAMNRWFFRVREMKAPYETNFDPDELDHSSMMVYVNYRVLDYQGNFIASTGVGLRLTTISQLIDRYEQQFNRRIFFVNKAGHIVLSGQTLQSQAGVIGDMPGIGGIATAILSGGSATSHLQYHRGDSLVLVNSRYIPELGWYLVVEEDDTAEIGTARRLLMVNLAIGVAISVLVLIGVQLAIRRYRTHIESMAANAVAQAAREKELATEQQRFVAMVSHEFRTPLAIIDTALQSVRHKGTEVSQDVATRLQIVSRAALRLQDLVENYLTKDRLAHACDPGTNEVVDLFVVIRRAVRRAESDRIVTEFSERSALVKGDPDLLRIAISNLVSNAIKYSGDEPVVRVSGTVVGERVEIRVMDNGPGIAPADLPHIFDLYYRGGGRTASGSGLGLYLVKRIVESHGGTVAADSTVGQGTTMVMRLPLCDPGKPPAAEPSSA
jgi:signal transduction histidine kinase